MRSTVLAIQMVGEPAPDSTRAGVTFAGVTLAGATCLGAGVSQAHLTHADRSASDLQSAIADGTRR